MRRVTRKISNKLTAALGNGGYFVNLPTFTENNLD
jgi:hypothetical protein